MYVNPTGHLRDLIIRHGHDDLLNGFEISAEGFEKIHADIQTNHPKHLTDLEKHALAVFATYYHPNYRKQPEPAPPSVATFPSPTPLNIPAPVVNVHAPEQKHHWSHWVHTAILLLIFLFLCASKAHCQAVPSSGLIVQGQNNGSILFTRAGGFFALNCAGTLGCTFSNNVFTLTGGGGGGTMTNPLTTQYDIIYAGNTASPATPVRLGLGANGTALGASGGVLGYYTIPTLLGYTPIQLSSLSATGPISYNNTTGVISCPTCSTSSGFTNPMTTLGDLIYGAASGTATRLAGDTSNTRKFLRSLSTTGTATAPVWDSLLIGDIPTGYAWSNLTGVPTFFYQTVQANAIAQTQRTNLNFSSNFSLADSAANNRTTVDLAGTITSNTSGNAATATALAANPTDCSANQYANTIAANGNLTCAQVDYSQLTGAPSLFYQTFQHDGTAVTQRPKFNLAAGSNITVTASDNGTDTTTFTVAASGSVGSAFNTISTGTNTTAAMTVGSGATLDFTGTGSINASKLAGSAYLNGTLTATVGTVVDGDCVQAGSITITGATLGDPVFAGVNLNLPSGVNTIAKVTGTDTVNVEVCNLSESAQTIASATYKVALLH